jgi:hypothetical protein
MHRAINLSITVLSVVMLGVIMLSVAVLSVIMLNVVAPKYKFVPFLNCHNCSVVFGCKHQKTFYFVTDVGAK